MGHTNSTANLALPQFIGTDKPTWLGDINGAFSAIDSYAGTNDAAVAAAVSDASSAISQASAAVNTANTANTTAGNASTAANNAIGVANTANAIAGTVDAKVGLLADLNTTDRTSIVNAINETLGKAEGHGLFEVWKNADISGAFASQTISVNVDVASVDALIIACEFSTSEQSGAILYEFDKDILPGTIGQPSATKYFGDLKVISNVLHRFSRDLVFTQIDANTVQIAFGDGEDATFSTYGSAPTTSTANNTLVPVRVLALKHND